MNTPEPEPGAGFIGYIMSLSLMGKLLFGSFLIGVPAILDLVISNGTRTEFQMTCAAIVPDRLQRLLLDVVRAGRLVAHSLR